MYFRIKPKNMSAMPKEKIQKEIEVLKTVIALSGYNLELSVFSSYENYDDVVQNYYDKAEEYRRENPKDIRIEMLSEDIRELYEINATRSGAKEFYIILRLNIAQRRDMDNAIMKTEKLIAEGDFNVKLSQGDELFDSIRTRITTGRYYSLDGLGSFLVMSYIFIGVSFIASLVGIIGVFAQDSVFVALFAIANGLVCFCLHTLKRYE